MRLEVSVPTIQKEAAVKNYTRAQNIIHSFSFLTGGRVLGEGFTFLMFVVLSRTFGLEGIGQYSFAMGFTCFFAVFCDFGLYYMAVKEFSQHDNSLGASYGRMISLRLILSAAVYGLLLLTLYFLPFSRDFKLIIALIGAYRSMQQLIGGATAIFVAREKTQITGAIEASLKAAAALAVISIAMAGGTLVAALASLPAVAGGQIIVSYALVSKNYGRPLLAVSVSSLMKTLRQTLPYGLSELFTQLYWRTDVVLLGFLLGAEAVGVYNVANRVVLFLIFIPQFASLSLLPVASRLYKNSKKDFELFYQQSFNLVVLIGLPISAGLWLVSPGLIKLVFGEAFAESSTVLRVLTGLLFLRLLSCTLGVFLMSCDRQIERTKGHWTVACLNVIANLVLIPVLKLNGAAIAALISDALLVVLFVLKLRGLLGWPRVSSRLGISALGVTFFCLPFAFFPSLSLGIVIPASMFIYCLVLLLFKEIRKNELHTLANLLKRQS
jgi:O-antigen/teichoic acid export membrane protein